MFLSSFWMICTAAGLLRYGHDLDHFCWPQCFPLCFTCMFIYTRMSPDFSQLSSNKQRGFPYHCYIKAERTEISWDTAFFHILMSEYSKELIVCCSFKRVYLYYYYSHFISEMSKILKLLWLFAQLGTNLKNIPNVYWFVLSRRA